MSAPMQLDDVYAPLLGTRVLVVEDDYLVATDVCRGLSDLGATVLGPAPTPFYALSMLGRRGVDVAVLDICLHRTTVFEVADELVKRNIPIVFATASSVDNLPIAYQGFPLLQKPVSAARLHLELSKALVRTRTTSLPQRKPSQPSTHGDHLVRAVLRALRRP